MESVIPKSSNRLTSLDVMRGLAMIFLAAESCGVYESLRNLHPDGLGSGLIGQFFHHPWHGLHLWDLVQPAFMLMAGSAMYLSYHSKLKKGISWQQNLRHILIRSARLFLLGTGLHCIYAGKLVWELWNVLTQLSFTTIIAYLIINRSYRFQIGFSVALLLLTEFLYRMVLMPGFSQPFVEYHNFGAWFDTAVLHERLNEGGWVAINIIPTAAHTIWGVLAGKLLLSDRSSTQKIQWLVIAGIAGLAIGFGLDMANVTPIIKRISTSSFVFASGGWVLLLLAFLYWLIDVRQLNKYAWIFTMVGMNAIFIYLFFETVGSQWFNAASGIFVKGSLGLLNVPGPVVAVCAAFFTLLLEWLLCYWLSKNKLFIRI